MNYNINSYARRNVMIGMMQESNVVERVTRMEAAALHPGGWPRVTEGCVMVEVVV